MPRLLLALTCMLFWQWRPAQGIAIIPQPVSLQTRPGIVPEGQPYAGGRTRFLIDEIRID